ncbi:NAD-binding protein [uncultured Kriegella sp.]|mgnify:CR=1 FL=1|uniref:potassium channel family protein n=1 Tax=uncultured Kriegella sp. TaxID=1798910 RepID=UPI0030DA1AA2|tara:strand:+ start:245270 stop:246979 length:1710 start_codon:yes stop_codon:yes gene_type:complete
MKFVSSQLAYYLKDSAFKRNARKLLRYVALLAVVVLIHSILFHIIMMTVEGRFYSWVTGFYWTLTVMSTLGFGDITFESDIGRLFSIIVLLSGIILLLVVLPFAFIRFFYVPYLDSTNKNKVPRQVPAGTKDHIIICSLEMIARDLTEKLGQEKIPYYIIESDSQIALERHDKNIPVILGESDEEETFRLANIDQAKLVLVNKNDTENTKIILTIRHAAPNVPIVVIANEEEAIHVLQLSGANHVLPVKKWLGSQLANRVNAQHAKSHPIGEYEDLKIAELAVHNTPLVNNTIRETNFRQKFGVSIVAVWKRGRLKPALAHEKLTEDSVLMIIGNEDQLQGIDELFYNYNVNPNPVLVIGGGRVGKAAAETLKENGILVNMIDKDSNVCKKVKYLCKKVFVGNASDYDLLKEAGILETPSVLLSTNDDTMNIYLASYCRQLNKNVRIVSRISDTRNIDIIHRAGADFVLSYATLGAVAVLSIVKGQKLTVLGEGVRLFISSIPTSLFGKTLAESGIGAKTGLSVIAINQNQTVITQLPANTLLSPGAEIVMIGNAEMKQKFNSIFGAGN